jgi:hypothetical protein
LTHLECVLTHLEGVLTHLEGVLTHLEGVVTWMPAPQREKPTLFLLANLRSYAVWGCRFSSTYPALSSPLGMGKNILLIRWYLT